MTTDQALEILDIAVSKISLTRGDHAQLITALETLHAAIPQRSGATALQAVNEAINQSPVSDLQVARP